MKWMLILALLVPLAAARDASAEERKLRDIQWQAAADEGGVVTIVAPPEGKTINLLKLEKPGITQAVYAIHGEVSYSDVAKVSYLEMWSYFDTGEFYFSRTLGTTGPMQMIRGSSDWRSFALPFDTLGKMLPNRIEVNLVLQGGGTVRLREARLVELVPPGQTAPIQASPPPAIEPQLGWWTQRLAGMFGGIFGGTIGICGAMIGLLAGRGKARNFVISLLMTLIVVGAMIFLLGIAALIFGQPYAVWYPLLLGGGLSAGMCAFLLPGIRRRYEQSELRRIQALDALG